MHLEVQVALNFVISYLYNKLPRRRVNIFGEELEKALKEKFVGHWYPDKPFKGSAFRCLKTGDPVDAVLERAAKESGVPVQDILENLPTELAVWVDPGEVSYRIGEKGSVKVLFSENDSTSLYHHHHHHHPAHNTGGITSADVSACLASLVGCNEETLAPSAMVAAVDRTANDQKTFNPEAQCFRPIDNCPQTTGAGATAAGEDSCDRSVVVSAMGSAAGSGATSPQPTRTPPSPAPNQAFVTQQHSPSAVTPRAAPAPLTFTTATFAQTKFGSTKLKTNSKRANRMSPTEFSNYIKQRALQQAGLHHGGPTAGGPNSPGGGRSLSPATGANHGGSAPHLGDYYYYPHHYPHSYLPQGHYNSGNGSAMSSGGSTTYLEQPYYQGAQMPPAQTGPGGPQGTAQSSQPPQALDKQLVDFGLSSQFQHLLVAN